MSGEGKDNMIRFGLILRSISNILLLFIAIAVVLSLPPAASAAEKTIGIIMTGNTPYYKEIHKAFIGTLAAEGFGPGHAEVVLQSPSPEPMSWVNAARKLVAVGSDIIVAYGAPATLAAMNETSSVPIVYAGVFDPAAVGATGKNATGISSKVPVASLLKNFRSISNFSSLGVVFSESEKDTVIQANEVKQMEGGMGFRSTKFSIKKAEDLSKIANVDALFLTTGCAAMHCINNIMGIARKSKIPTASTIGGGENIGVVLTITANPQEQGMEAAKLAAKVIRGAKPSGMQVVSPRRIDMIINLREATELGLKIPFDLLSSATRVIK